MPPALPPAPLLLCAALVAAAAAAVLVTQPPPVEPNNDHTILVNGSLRVHVEYANGQYLRVTCDRGAERALDAAALPPLRTRVLDASVDGCAPPAAGYAALLARLRVQLLPAGSLSLELPAAGAPLDAAHLASLALASLQLRARRPTPPPAPRAGLLAALPGLSRLVVRGVPLPPDALSSAPAALASLTLMSAGAVVVPARVLRGLTALAASREVVLEGEAPVLRVLSLTLGSGEVPPAWARFPAAAAVSLTGWDQRAPSVWANCSALTSLTLTSATFSSLPARWLAACDALQTLEVQSARRLRTLPPALLAGECPEGAGCSTPAPALALTRLVIRYSALETLPDSLFDAVPNLQYLDLKHNKLRTLPNGIFAKPIKLTTLILAENHFEADVYQQLRPLRALRELDLSGNRRLGDACSARPFVRSDESELSPLKALRKLQLSRTAVTRICSDWRVGMPHLALLLLQSTNISRLSFHDLQFERDNETLSARPRVDLLGSPVRLIEYSAEDEARALRVPPARVQLLLSEPLRCDCDSFRAVRAIRTRPDHADLGGALQCAGEPRRALATVPLDDMLCAAPDLCPALPPACRCRAREQGTPDAPLWHVRVDCERAGLREPPALAAPPGNRVEWDLRLAGNHIVELDHLPPHLTALDLRNVSLRRVSVTAAAALVSLGALRLADNPLECGCEAAALLDAVAALRRRLPAALDDARCGDGRSLAAAAAERLACAGGGAWGAPALGALGATLGALALAALVLGVALTAPTRRARLKGLLLRWGWLPRPAEADEALPFDVFVSFAHEDAWFARELAARLEAGPRALRLCLHERDWAPGEYIDAQIAASVRCARRTLAVVSRSWVRSRWARVELREALAAGGTRGAGGGESAPRLVLVLLEEASALAALDRELRRCLAACTYLQHDHPRFWERLREALPAPHAPPPAPAPAAAPAAAAA